MFYLVCNDIADNVFRLPKAYKFCLNCRLRGPRLLKNEVEGKIDVACEQLVNCFSYTIYI